MTKSLQQKLNDRGMGNCRIDSKGRLQPCGYHENRARNSAFRLNTLEGYTNNPTVYHVPVRDDTKRLARLFAEKICPPAGGWYLLARQRRWLRDRLTTLIENSRLTTLRVLEAGAAGHVHHFTFLAILQELFETTSVEKIEVVLADICIMPALSIREVRRQGMKAIRSAGALDVSGHRVIVDDSFADLLAQTHILEDERLVESAVQEDLADPNSLSVQAAFDVVTEHFISAVVADWDLRSSFRATYSRVLKPGGHVLSACGFTNLAKPSVFKRFRQINEERGLEVRDLQAVWDPYGLTEEQVAVLAEGKSLTVHADNTLFDHQRI